MRPAGNAGDLAEPVVAGPADMPTTPQPSLVMSPSSLTRRTFLKTSAGLAAGGTLTARSWGQVVGANSDVRVGTVGLRGRGGGFLNDFREAQGVRFVAICDVDSA